MRESRPIVHLHQQVHLRKMVGLLAHSRPCRRRPARRAHGDRSTAGSDFRPVAKRRLRTIPFIRYAAIAAFYCASNISACGRGPGRNAGFPFAKPFPSPPFGSARNASLLPLRQYSRAGSVGFQKIPVQPGPCADFTGVCHAKRGGPPAVHVLFKRAVTSRNTDSSNRSSSLT